MASLDVKIIVPEGISKAPEILVAEVERAVLNSSLAMERAAKGFTPSETGNLRRSIGPPQVKSLAGKVTGLVETAVPYAKYVEFGTGIYASNGNGRKTPWVYKNRDGQFIRTRGQKPKFFMKKGFELKKDSAVERVRKAVQTALDKMAR